MISLWVNIILFLFLFYFVFSIIKFHLLSPIYLYILYNVVTIVFSTIYFFYSPFKISLYHVDEISKTTFLNTIDYYIFALNAFMMAVIVYYDLSAKNVKQLFNRSIDFLSKINFNFLTIDEKFKKKVIIFHVFIFLLFIIGYGKHIFYRDIYLSTKVYRPVVLLVKIFSFIGVFLDIFIYPKHKKLSVFLFSIILMFFLGTASRVGFLFLAIYIVLTFLMSKNKSVYRKIRVVFLLVLSFVYLAYLIKFRHLPKHGIIPYFYGFFSLGKDIWETIYFNVYYNFIFGVFVTANTMKVAAADWKIIKISLHPLLGSMVGWYQYADLRRLNIYAPFSTHGEVFRMGRIFTFIFTFVLGLLFTFFEKVIRKKLVTKKYLIAFIVYLLLALHIFYAFEYNLRASVRYLYYGLFVVFILFVIKWTNKFLKLI